MSYTVTLGTSSLEITLDLTANNTAELIPKSSIRGVKIVKRGTLAILLREEHSTTRKTPTNNLVRNLDLTDISNQPTWSLGTLASDQAAVTSFNTWLATGGGGGGGGGGGDASAANQVTGNISLSSIDTKLSSQSTAANQTTGNNSIASIDTKTPTVGQKTMANSTPVVIASDQSTIPVSIIGVATETTLSSLNSKLPISLGTKVSASSLSVVLASDQTSLPLSSNASQETGGNLSIISTNGLVSITNSSIATLAISGVFTGVAEDITQYGYINISVFSDVASSTDGLSIQQSSNGTNWDITDSYTVPATSGKTFSVARCARFFRIVYTNGGTIQTTFRLQTIYTKGNVKPSSVRPQDGRSNENDMEEMLAYGMLFNGSTWDRALKGQQAATSSQAVTLSNENTQDLYVTGAAAQTATVNNILTVASGATATDVQMYRAFAIQVVSTASGGTYIFEGSNDNTNFQSIPVFNQALAIPVPIVTAITATASQIIYVGATMFRYVRLRIVTTITGGSIQAFSTFTQTPFSISQTVVAQGTAANLNTTIGSGTITTVSTLSNTTQLTPGVAAANLGKAEDAVAASGDTGVAVWGVRNDTLNSAVTNATGDYIQLTTDTYGCLVVKDQLRHKRTYSLAFNVAAAATATDIFQLIGSATTSVQITKIRISGIQTTAGNVLFVVQKRSTANTGGTSTSATIVPHQSTDAAATAVGTIYTANPSALGTSVGDIKREYVPIGSATLGSNAIEYNFADRGKPIILAGVAQALAINLNGATVAGGNIAIEIELTEE